MATVLNTTQPSRSSTGDIQHKMCKTNGSTLGEQSEEDLEHEGIIKEPSYPVTLTGSMTSLKTSDENYDDKTPSRGKSVVFHSETSQPPIRKIYSASDCWQYMMDGSSMVKLKSSSRQYRRYFILEEDLSTIRWVPSAKQAAKAKLSIRCVHEVRAGKTTELLRRKDIAGGYDEACAFSIIYGNRYKSLDLIASSADEANIWISGLSVLVSGNEGNMNVIHFILNISYRLCLDLAYIPEKAVKRSIGWLHSAFHQSNRDGKGTLDDKETIALVKKLNNHMSSVSVKQKIMELNMEKMGRDRGRLNSCQFINLFKSTATRPEIYFLLIRYSGKDYMTAEDFHLFLEGEQGVYGVTLDECRRLIEKYEPSEESKRKHQLLIDGFTRFLLSEYCDVMNPSHQSVFQDMSQPLAQYVISSSSTFIHLQNREIPLSTVEWYRKALKFGCRSITVECWDAEDEPVVSRPDTASTETRLSQVLEVISTHAFSLSEYPLVICLQNHCSLQGQLQVVSLIREKLGSHLVFPNLDDSTGDFKMSPESLKRKILLKGKTLPSHCSQTGEVSEDEEFGETNIPCKKTKKIQLCKELSDLMILHSIRFTDFKTAYHIQKPTDVCSLDTSLALKLIHYTPEDLLDHSQQFIFHVRLSKHQIISENFNPLYMWSSGYQMVAVNVLTPGETLDVSRAWFQQNGGCGYVLKPSNLRHRIASVSSTFKRHGPGLNSMVVHLRIISGQELPVPSGGSRKANAIDPYVQVQLFGVPADCAAAHTKTVSNQGHSPLFEESFKFLVTVPELAVLRFIVLDDEYIGDDFIGQYSIPVSCLQTGYRHLHLLNKTGELLRKATLFIHIAVTRHGRPRRQPRKKYWQKKLKTTGVADIDKTFKKDLGKPPSRRSSLVSPAKEFLLCDISPFVKMELCYLPMLLF
ncbi:inactive phospholipase C-like protein 2 [Limulus polyphemus]|uniref:Phosphoinositide phospholipase C n=1 Tax=Limulus polyphemus TaxID=6850 RepID=A0ABM1T214_LIMPO|nr:inactive phospholipase C-like protein 2 [Limulus polyphemus]